MFTNQSYENLAVVANYPTSYYYLHLLFPFKYPGLTTVEYKILV